MKSHIFTIRERRGLMILAVILTILTSFRILYQPPLPQPDPDILAFVLAMDSIRQSESPGLIPPSEKIDINKEDAKGLMAAGMPRIISYRLVKYRDNYGPFSSVDQLKKIYGMTDSLVGLLDSIAIPFPPKQNTVPITKSKKSVAMASGSSSDSSSVRRGDQRFYQARQYNQYMRDLKIAINSDGPEEWKKLKGIGDVLSNRIVVFRDKLGGFFSVEQVAETYGLPPETFELIRPSLYLDKPQLKMPIASVSIRQLAAHPYIHYSDAKKIFAFLEQHRPIKTQEQLRKMKAIPPSRLEKILPYFEFENQLVSSDSLQTN